MKRLHRRPDTTVAASALATGCLVYAFARPHSLFAVTAPQSFFAWTAALPSFLHTLAFALLCATLAPTRRVALLLATAWGAFEVAAEFAQAGRAAYLPGTFDWFDIAAVVLATALALAVVRAGRRGHPSCTA